MKILFSCVTECFFVEYALSLDLTARFKFGLLPRFNLSLAQ
ncbi:MAG: hypothetical protein SPL83_10865 [Succinivibrio sp.]|nr:hypothetical protein [Succinivibrio sp.]MDY6261330.1 hypothetical protein [Succinivibrio sp.]